MSLTTWYPVQVVCEVVGYPRSSYYAQRHSQQPKEETQLKATITDLAGQWPTYGYRRITAMLHRQGQLVNSKRVRRLMGHLGLKGKPVVKRCRTTNSNHRFGRYPNLVYKLKIIQPEQVWVGDITYIRLNQEFIYLAVVMDVFTRSIRGWHLGRSLSQELSLTALNKALANHQPQIHHSDQGVQYAATAYVQRLREHKIAISMAEVGEPRQNGYAERLMRTIKEAEVDLSDYQSFADAYHHIGQFLEQVYLHQRIHSSLGYLTPGEFEAQWLKEHSLSNTNKEVVD